MAARQITVPAPVYSAVRGTVDDEDKDAGCASAATVRVDGGGEGGIRKMTGNANCD